MDLQVIAENLKGAKILIILIRLGSDNAPWNLNQIILIGLAETDLVSNIIKEKNDFIHDLLRASMYLWTDGSLAKIHSDLNFPGDFLQRYDSCWSGNDNFGFNVTG